MKISVIIPVYNVEPWIEESLLSVLEQDFPLIECIVVDDASVDSSMSIVARVQKKHERGHLITVLRHELNQGQAAARNMGTAAATGDYLFYLDGDDAFAERTSLSALAKAAMRVDAEMVQGNFLRVDTYSGREWITSFFDPSIEAYGRHEIAVHFDSLNFANATNKLISIAFIRANQLTFEKGLLFEDTLWGMQAYRCLTRLAVTDKITYRHNIRGGSTMTTPFNRHKINSLLHVITELSTFDPKDSNIERVVSYYAVYMLKNLFIGKFDSTYRREIFSKLLDERSRGFVLDGVKFTAFSHLLSYTLTMPRTVAWYYCTIITTLYGAFLKTKKLCASL